MGENRPGEPLHPRSPDALALLHQAGGGGGPRPALGAGPAGAGRSGGAAHPRVRGQRQGGDHPAPSPHPHRPASACWTWAGPSAPGRRSSRRICAMKPEPRWVPGREGRLPPASSWFMLGRGDPAAGRPPVRPSTSARRSSSRSGWRDSWIGMPPERYLSYKDAGRIGAMWNTEGPEPKDHGWDTEERCVRPNPGGNGYGPMRELGRFYEMLLGAGRLDGRRILSPQTVEAMTARAPGGDDGRHLQARPGLGAGLHRQLRPVRRGDRALRLRPPRLPPHLRPQRLPLLRRLRRSRSGASPWPWPSTARRATTPTSGGCARCSTRSTRIWGWLTGGAAHRAALH